MHTLYILTAGWDYEGEDVLGVFTSKKAALIAAEETGKPDKDGDRYHFACIYACKPNSYTKNAAKVHKTLRFKKFNH